MFNLMWDVRLYESYHYLIDKASYYANNDLKIGLKIDRNTGHDSKRNQHIRCKYVVVKY